MPLTDPCPACGKVCYSFAEARKRAMRANRRGDPEYKGMPATPYRCKKGGASWHFGHSGDRRSRRRRG